MFCRKCGAQNEDGAKFCGKCGEKLVEIKVEKHQEETPRREHSGTKAEKKKKGKVIAVIFGVILLLLALALAGFFVRKTLKEKQYADAMDRGQKYLEELDYESAEAEFLEALSIAPKEPESYFALADLYLAQDEPEKAIEILEQAAENVPEEVQKEMKESDQKDIGEKLEEVKNLEKYTWVVEPEIEADDIFYLAAYPNIKHSVNELSKQADNLNAVIQKGNEYGIIDFNGKLLTEVAYKEIANFGDYYMMISTVPKYSEEYDQDWETYGLDKDGKIVACEGNGYLESTVYYYYNGIRQRTGFTRSDSEEETIPVQESSVYDLYDIALIMENLSGKYALEYNGELITDFVYDECGSMSDGLLAVCQNEKWGYVDEKGQVVIPLEYDTSWEQYPVFDGGFRRSTDNVKKYCYAASDGYVTLCKDGKWELRNTKGALVIMPGVFEKICPVYDGKCWVKRNGKWGVIALEGKGKTSDKLSSATNDDRWKELYINYIKEEENRYYDEMKGSYLEVYKLIDINDDLIPELYIEHTYDSEICSYYDGKTFSLAMGASGDAGGVAGKIFYMEGKNLIMGVSGGLGAYFDKIYRINKGEFELLHEGMSGVIDQSNLQLDENGAPIYDYYWNGKKVSKEQYQQELKEIFDVKKAKNLYYVTSDDASRYVENGLCDYDEIIEAIENY